MKLLMVVGCIACFSWSSSFAQESELPENVYFDYPVPVGQFNPYSFGRPLGAVNWNGSYHGGEDVALPAWTPVLAIGDGRLVIYQSDTFWRNRRQGGRCGYGVLYAQAQYRLNRRLRVPTGAGGDVFSDTFTSLSGHIIDRRTLSWDASTPSTGWAIVSGYPNRGWGLVMNDDADPNVSHLDIIGYVAPDAPDDSAQCTEDDYNGDGLAHMHGGAVAGRAQGAIAGYVGNVGGFLPMHLVIVASRVGVFQERNGDIRWRTDGNSQAIFDKWWEFMRIRPALQQYHNKLGRPNNNHPYAPGQGTDFVHYWYNIYIRPETEGVWIQDFIQPYTTDHNGRILERFGVDGQCAIILNERINPPRAFLIREGMWGWYKSHEGYVVLGRPLEDEQDMGNNVAQQRFERGYLRYHSDTGVVGYYNNGTVITVSNGTIRVVLAGGETVSVPVGNFTGTGGGSTTPTGPSGGYGNPEPLLPEITVTATSHDYGEVEIGKKAVWYFWVKNPGKGTLKIEELFPSSPYLPQFWTNPNPHQRFFVSPGDSQRVEVYFTPTSTLPIVGTLILSDNVGGVDDPRLSLSGRGKQAATVAVKTDTAATSTAATVPAAADTGITVKSVTTNSAYGSDLSFAHDGGSGDNRVLIVQASTKKPNNCDNGVDTPSAVTFNGASLMPATETPVPDDCYMWTGSYFLSNPAEGVNTVVVDGIDGNTIVMATALTVSGVDIASPIGATASGIGISRAQKSLVVTTTKPNSLLLDVAFNFNGGVLTAGVGQSAQANFSQAGGGRTFYQAVSAKATTTVGSYDMSWKMAKDGRLYLAVMELVPRLAPVVDNQNSGSSTTVDNSGTDSTGQNIGNTGSITENQPAGGNTSAPAPIVSVYASGFGEGSTGSISIPYDTPATIQWRAENASDCLVSPSGWTGVNGEQTTGNLTAGTVYTVSCNGPGGTAVASVAVNIRLAAPKPYYPSNGASNVPIRPDLLWETSVGATAYELQISTSPSFSALIVPPSGSGGFDQYGFASRSFLWSDRQYSHVPSLAENTLYYWRVRAQGGAWSELFRFTTIGAPPLAPTGLTAKVGNHYAVLVWKRNQEKDLAYYVVYRSLWPDFTPSRRDSLAWAGKVSASYYDVAVRNGLTFYYRLVAVDSVGNRSEPSKAIAAKPQGRARNPSSKPAVANLLALEQNFPNPFNAETVISYFLPREADVRLAAYNLVGQEVAVLVSEQQEAGEHSVRFAGENLPSGVYFIRLVVGQEATTRRMLLIK